MTTFPDPPAAVDVQRARTHAHAPGRPSPLRECFDAEDLELDADRDSSCPRLQAPKITLKFTVPILSPPPIITSSNSSGALAPDGKGSHHWSASVASVGMSLAPSDKHTSLTSLSPPSPIYVLSEQPNLLNVYYPPAPRTTSLEQPPQGDTGSDENMRRYNDDPFKRARWTPSTSTSDIRGSTIQASAPSQSLTYTPYKPLPPPHPAAVIAAAAQKNYEFVASLKRAPEWRQAKVDAQNHLLARLRHFESRRAELQATLGELKQIRRKHLTDESDARANVQSEASQSANGRASQVAEDNLISKTMLRQWTDDDIKYDEHALAKVETEIRRWKQFAGEITRGEPCSRPRLKLNNDRRTKRPRAD